MRICLMSFLIVTLAGCGGSGVEVNATSDKNDDVFRAPEAYDDEKPAARTGEDGQPRRRTPFITLGAYDWDYDLFLSDLKYAISDLELPRSAESRAVLVFRTGMQNPVVVLECAGTPVECADLRDRLESRTAWPRLPATFPHEELEVTLSNLP